MPWSSGQSWGEKQISTTIYAAVTVLPLAGIGLGAIEFSHYTSAQSELQSVLADGVAQVVTGSGEDENELQDYVSSSVSDPILPESVIITVPEGAFSQPGIDVTAEARIRTRFLWVIGVNTLELREAATAIGDTKEAFGTQMTTSSREKVISFVPFNLQEASC